MTKEEIKKKVYKDCPYDHKCEKEFTRWSILEETENNEAKIVPCPCAEKADRYYRYMKAGVEPEYWSFEFEDLHENFNKDILDEYASVFIKKTKACIDNKACLWFYGRSGSGTTSLAVLILKHILDSGYKGRILTANDVVSILYHKDISELKDYDFLVIDAVDRISNQVAYNFSIVVSELIDKKSIIFTSMIHSSKLSPSYHDDFTDRVKNIPNVKFPDINFREKVQSKFDAVKDA